MAVGDERKRCRTCRRKLPLSRFGQSRSRDDGLKPDCRACRRQAT